MAGFTRYHAILRLFSAQTPAWTVPAMSDALGVPASTIYRTVRELTEAAFLEPSSAASYRLGAAFIEYDRLLRLTDPHSRILQLFVLLMSLQLLLTPYLADGVQDVLHVVAYFGILVYFARAVKYPRAYYWLGFVVASLVAVGSLVYYLQKDQLPYLNPNAFASFPMAGLYAICLSINYTKGSRAGRNWLFVLAALNFGLVFLSTSRGNILSGLVCLLYLLSATRSLSRSTLFLMAALSLGVLLSTRFIAEQERSVYRLEKTFDTSITLQSRTSGRNLLAQAGLDLFRANPLGIGTGAYRHEISQLDYLQEDERPAHSAWVKVLAENGVIGILLLTAFVLSFTLAGFQRGGYAAITLGLMLTASLALAYISREFQSKGLWMLSAGGVVLLHKDLVLDALEGRMSNRLVRKYRPRVTKSDARRS